MLSFLCVFLEYLQGNLGIILTLLNLSLILSFKIKCLCLVIIIIIIITFLSKFGLIIIRQLFLYHQLSYLIIIAHALITQLFLSWLGPILIEGLLHFLCHLLIFIVNLHCEAILVTVIISEFFEWIVIIHRPSFFSWYFLTIFRVERFILLMLCFLFLVWVSNFQLM